MRWPWQRREADKPAVTMSTNAPARVFTLGWDEFPWWHERSQQLGACTREFALSVSSVLKSRNIICGTIAALPMAVTDADNNVIRSALLEQIDPDVPNPVTIASLVEDLLFDAIGWLRVLARDSGNYPVYARRIDPCVVSATPPPGYVLADLPSGFVPGSTLWVGGEPVQARDMIRFDSPNPAILIHGARTIRRMHRLEQAAEMYAASPQMRGWFTPKDNADPDQKVIDDFLADWKIRREAGADGYVPSSFERHAEQMPTPADMQLTTIIEKTTVAVADLFGLDPEDLGVSMTRNTYNNAVDRRQDKKNETFAGLCAAIEARLSMGDVTRRGQRAIFDWDTYLQPNPTDRATIAVQLTAAKIATVDEMRAVDRRPPLTAAQEAELSPPVPTPEPAPAPDPNAPEAPVQAAGRPALRLLTAPAVTFPYTIGKDKDACPASKPWALKNADTGRLLGCHETQADAEQQMRAVGASSHGFAAANFSSTGPVCLTFDSGDDESFAVDMTRRTITGRVMPWGEIGRSGGAKWRFLPGSLKYNPGKIAQLKFMVDHSTSQPVGYTVRTWSDETGQWATYKVGRGPVGDQALQDAHDRVRDGLSVGIGFEGDESDIRWVPDPTDPTVRLVTSAPWRETSLVALPAFAGARVSAVSMAADPTGVPMPCQLCGQTHAAGVACPTTTPPAQQPPATPAQQPAPPAPAGQTFSAEQALQLFQGTPEIAAAALNAYFAAPKPSSSPLTVEQIAALRNVPGGDKVIAKAFGITPEPPAVVNPTALPLPGQQRTATAQVREQPLYRFDGQPAQRCFSTDLKNRFGGDATLIAKSEEFIAAAMAKAFAAIATTDVDELNPVIQRPDLFVPKLTFNRVLGSMTQGGAVSSLTAFKYPKFNSDSGLVGDHTPGTEPTEGAVSTTSGDVNPAGLSGLLILQREVIDQGGNPQLDSLLWSLMTQAYAEALETRMQDLFESLSLTASNVVGIDGELSANLLTILTALQFTRGGDRFSAFAADSTLYAALAGANDEMGRPLFPMDAPQNANGSTAGDLSTLRVHGKVCRPAWALESANGGEGALSYLWAPGSVYQWFSAPRRIDLEVYVSKVQIGIWGYSAEFTTRSTDVKELAYSIS